MAKHSSINYWFKNNGLLLLLTILGMHAHAQNTFITQLNQQYTTADDIIEDNKGGIVVSLFSTGFIRLNSSGAIIGRFNPFQGSRMYKMLIYPGATGIYCCGYGAEVLGGFQFGKFDVQGNILVHKLILPNPTAPGDTGVRIEDMIYDSERRIFVVCGERYRVLTKNSESVWIAGVDTLGNILWQNNFRPNKDDYHFKQILKNKKTGGYLCLSEQSFNYSSTDATHLDAFYLLDSFGKLLFERPFHNEPCSNGGYGEISNLVVFNDTQFFGNVNFYQCGFDLPHQYFYNFEGKIINKGRIQDQYNIIMDKNNQYYYTYFNNAIIEKYLISNNTKIATFDFLKMSEFPRHSTMIYQFIGSRDGGFIGHGNVFGYYFNLQTGQYEQTQFLKIFKCDSMGDYHFNKEYIEREQPLFVVPNPAGNKVRVSIPYYYGNVHSRIYTLQGKLLQEQTHKDTDDIDLSQMANGVYMVYGTNLLTNETRKMKMVVVK